MGNWVAELMGVCVWLLLLFGCLVVWLAWLAGWSDGAVWSSAVVECVCGCYVGWRVCDLRVERYLIIVSSY